MYNKLSTDHRVVIGRWRKIMAVVVVGSVLALVVNAWAYVHYLFK